MDSELRRAIEPLEGRLPVVVGPTASGKTDLAIELAAVLDGEIVGADSVQVYRGFDIGSGKPTPAERARTTHHLVDVAEPTEPIDAARYASLADEAIASARARGKVPIVCGGTYLWIKALVAGLLSAPPPDPALRRQHEERAAAEGRAALHRELASVDPVLAQKLHENDLVRVSRALEVYAQTGIPMSTWQAEHGFREPRYEVLLLGVDRPREELDRRIEERADAWLQTGWIEEVESLCERGLGETRPMASVGYRQVRAHVAGELEKAQLLPEIVRATRVFVRRQRTWLRDEPVTWLARK